MKLPKYLPLVIAASERRDGSGIYHIEIRHDLWCDLLNGRGECNCNPELGEVWAEPGPAT